MRQPFQLHKATRENLLALSQNFTTEQFNFIPAGFNNNLIWNLAHVVVTQQLLIYKMSANEIRIDKGLVEKYRKGTKPEGDLSASEIETIQGLLLHTSTLCEKDYEAGLFSQYKPYSTSYGIVLNSIEDALAFNNVHEAMHLGNILSMRKLLL